MAELTVDDIQARVGRTFTDTETTQVQAWISDVLALAARIAPDMDPADMPDAVFTVLAGAVVRCVYNPAGVKSYSAGAVSYTAGDDASTGAGRPVLDDADTAVIERAYGKQLLGQIRTPPLVPAVVARMYADTTSSSGGTS